jgi:hypothetical protein
MKRQGNLVKFTHFHGYCGLGGAAQGFGKSSARWKDLEASFVCLGGFDSDPGAVEAFTRRVGVQGTVLDMFTRDDYEAFHGSKPPAGWKEASLADVWAAMQGEVPDVYFASPPCQPVS